MKSKAVIVEFLRQGYLKQDNLLMQTQKFCILEESDPQLIEALLLDLHSFSITFKVIPKKPIDPTNPDKKATYFIIDLEE